MSAPAGTPRPSAKMFNFANHDLLAKVKVYTSREQVEADFQANWPEYAADLMKLHDDMTAAVFTTLHEKS